MSQENAGIVCGQLAATNRADFARRMTDWAEDIEIVPVPGTLPTGPASGREAAEEYFGDWFTAFGGRLQIEIEKIEAAGDAVIVDARHTAVRRHSGIEVANRFFCEYRLLEGKIKLIKFHRSWAGALEAVGLSE